jgi:hypothetical protein
MSKDWRTTPRLRRPAVSLAFKRTLAVVREPPLQKSFFLSACAMLSRPTEAFLWRSQPMAKATKRKLKVKEKGDGKKKKVKVKEGGKKTKLKIKDRG